MKINLAATLEQALIKKVRKERRNQWLEDNKQAIKACNKLTEQNGLFADKHRGF